MRYTFPEIGTYRLKEDWLPPTNMYLVKKHLKNGVLPKGLILRLNSYQISNRIDCVGFRVCARDQDTVRSKSYTFSLESKYMDSMDLEQI